MILDNLSKKKMTDIKINNEIYVFERPPDGNLNYYKIADDFNIITFCFGSNSLSDFSTLLTPSLSNKVIIQLLLVSLFLSLIVQLCKICIGVIK